MGGQEISAREGTVGLGQVSLPFPFLQGANSENSLRPYVGTCNLTFYQRQYKIKLALYTLHGINDRFF